MNNLKILFSGTPDFAVESLIILIENGYNICGVITAPDKPAGRGMVMQQSAVKKYAQSKGLLILQPEKLKDTTLINSYMQDSILKNVKFDNIDFTKAQIFNTRLKDIDLSTCIIQGLSTTLVDIKGAIINELQIMDLAYLLNIKIKD